MFIMNDSILFRINSLLIAIIDFEVNKFFIKHSYIINQLNSNIIKYYNIINFYVKNTIILKILRTNFINKFY